MAAKKTTMCPDCFMMDGTDTPLDPPRAGAQARCQKGHTWDDMEVLQDRLTRAKAKRVAIDRQNNPVPDETPQQKKARIDAMQKPKGDEIVICRDDYQRIAGKLGDFPDGATLFGKIIALQMDMQGLSDQLAELRSKAAAVQPSNQPGAMAPPSMASGGDLQITIIIPEQYVQPIKDIAESTNTNTVAYVNSIVESGLENGWFF